MGLFLFTTRQFVDKNSMVINGDHINKEPKFIWFVAREVNKPLIVKIKSAVLKVHDGLDIVP